MFALLLTGCTRSVSCERYMYEQINANRGDDLVFDYGIQNFAVDWSGYMALTQSLTHNPNYGEQIAAHRNYMYAGENVGRGANLDTLFQAFINSPGHLRNIQNRAYTHVTIGCVKDANGRYWVTQNFWGLP